MMPNQEHRCFWHHADSAAYPVKIEKQDENHWIVVFEKRR
jgi:hypothetical protein